MEPITPAAAKPTMLKEQTINGLRVIYLGPSALVGSEREPGAWYHVDEGRQCTCPDHVYRGSVCKHMIAVSMAMELDRLHAVPVAEAAPIETPPQMYPSTCPPTMEAWLPEPAPAAEATYWVMSGEYAGEAVRLLEPGRCGGWDLVQHVKTGARFTVEPGGLLADQPAATETVQPSQPVNLRRTLVSASALFTMPED